MTKKDHFLGHFGPPKIGVLFEDPSFYEGPMATLGTWVPVDPCRGPPKSCTQKWPKMTIFDTFSPKMDPILDPHFRQYTSFISSSE